MISGSMVRAIWWVTLGAFLVVALSVLTIIVLPGFNLVARLNRVAEVVAGPGPVPPITPHNQRFEWIGPRTLQSHSDGSTWAYTCQLVLTSRGALTDDGGYIGLTAFVVSGPLKGAKFDPRFQIEDMTPQERPGSVIQYEIPPWVKDADLDGLLTYSMIQRVPVDKASATCPAGRWETSVTIPKNSAWRALHGGGPGKSLPPR